MVGVPTLPAERQALSQNLTSALTNRYGGVEGPPVDRRRPSGLVDRLLVIALAVSVIGFTVLPLPFRNLAATVESWTSGRITSPVAPTPPMTPLLGAGDYRASVTVVSDPPRAFPESPSSSFVNQDSRRGQGDARLYLRDAAAAAHRHGRARPGQGETRTDLWINAPESIASTSPRAANPATPSVGE